MNWLVFHIASGGACFAGLALLLVAVVIRTSHSNRSRRIATWCVVLGLVALAVSATPLPYWADGLILLAVVAGPVARLFGVQRTVVATASAVMLVGVGLFETRYHFMPALQSIPDRRVAVIGDSMTAGQGGTDTTTKWPAILRDRHRVEVQDLSRAGATAASAARQLHENPVDAPVVLVEIGGNDILGGTAPGGFETGLESLLAGICRPGRQVLMFELPLPPLYERYGRVQREVARRHGVALIPKRVLLSVIEPRDATVDSIHLTQKGHDRMASCVWAILRPAMPPAPKQPLLREPTVLPGQSREDNPTIDPHMLMGPMQVPSSK